MNITLEIENKGLTYTPILVGTVTLQSDRVGVPGSLIFDVLKDENLNFVEGNAVKFVVDGVHLFYGFVFTKKRDKEGIITVTAYDQLRYFKNKDTIKYENKTTKELIEMLCADYHLSTGFLEDTKYKVPPRIESDTTLFDMVLTSLDLTMKNKKEMYVMYDDYGKITLKNISNMIVNILIDEKTAENFSYTSSIDNNTYNQVKLVYENSDSGKLDIYMTKSSENINRWGVLQLYEKLNENENGKEKADALLALYNKKTRSISIDNALGDLRVRAGSMIYVKLDVGDLVVGSLMLVEKCKHSFNEGVHFMDLELRNGDFNA